MEQGIFFTPKKARDLLFDQLEEIGVRPRRILEPSFGSGEFLYDAMERYPDAEIIGVEKNQELFDAMRKAQPQLALSRI
jgi:tRNA G46 methylase TrmB